MKKLGFQGLKKEILPPTMAGARAEREVFNSTAEYWSTGNGIVEEFEELRFLQERKQRTSRKESRASCVMVTV